ncbi:hypothetical protein [Nostoc sp. UIC 10630]|uniref:hypothetical protein n=1 Tax=Nostoc sp. UIC 10630 TaxID=2100146 RepID=UPI0013D52A32|nr:hypothetical protein [Nostoc sp. UIC 10630]NEU81196.1 hypothetical protein [Nostoc sp. UIC 10630]
MANSSNWQDSLDEGLVNRLHRPLRQPGMMKMAMGQRIINRCDRFLNRLPLLNQQMRRWGNTNTLSSESMPIVYAQPVSLAQEQQVENRVHNLPTVSQVEPSANIIQRKLDSSQFLPTRAVNNTIPVQNITELSSSHSADEATQSLTLKTQIDKTSISSSEVPVVSPKSIDEHLPKTAEMTLADLTDSQISLPNSVESNFNHLSQPIVDTPSIFSPKIPVVSPQPITEQLPKTADLTDLQTSLPNSTESNLNHPSQSIVDSTSVFSSEIPVVSPQPIAEQFPHIGEMTLGDLTDSQTFPLNNAESNLNHPSQPIVDANSIFSSEIPVVSPQSITEQLPRTAEMLSSQEFTSLPDTKLPLIQAKFQNYSRPQGSLSIVNDLNNLAGQQQAQADNLSSTKHENLISQISSKKLPIVTAQPISPQVNLTKQKISFAINSPTSQNKPVSALDTQPVTISTSQINHKQNTSPLPLVSVSSASNPSLKPQSLPLPGAKTTPSSKSNSHQANISNRNSISNTDSPPITFSSPVSPIETSVSPIATQSNIDVDAIASQVERKLMRRLVIESERRGKNRWH